MQLAHPRSRGEHLSPWAEGLSMTGSSPLARGTPGLRHLQTRPTGLIPARAGNTAEQYLAGGNVRAHPRSRGEHTATSTIESRR